MADNSIKNYYDTYHSGNKSHRPLKIKRMGCADAHYSTILNLMKVETGTTIIDIGCGTGNLLEEAEKRGLICCGMDISESAVREAERKTKARYICGDIESGIPYPDESFDYVTCLGVWEHIKDQENVLKEMIRILKITGKMSIFVPNDKYILHWLGYETDHQPVVNRYSLNGHIKRIADAGLCIDEVYKNNSHLSNLNESTGYVKHCIKFLIHPFLSLLPIELSYHFLFICSKKQVYLRKG